MVFIQAINCCSFCLRYTLTGVPLNDTNRSLTSSNTAPYIEILRGRDGRDGRDGAPGPQGLRGLLVYKVHLVPGVLESHTLGGGRPPVQVYQELNWFIKE